MTNKDDDKKKPPPQPVNRYQAGGNKPEQPKQPPQPVRRVEAGGAKPEPPKQPPQPVRTVQTGGPKQPTTPAQPSQPVRRVQTGDTPPPAKTPGHDLPKPPERRIVRPGTAVAGATVAGAAVGAAASQVVAPEMQAKVTAVQSKYERLETAAQLSDIYSAIGRIDAKLTELPFELEKQRNRGYVHGGQLENKLVALDDKWDNNIRPRVETTLKEQVARLDSELNQAESMVKRVNPRVESTVKLAETAVDSLERRVTAAQDAVTSLYRPIENEVNEAERQVNNARQMLDLLDGSQAIRLRNAEGPLLAVETEWHRNGKEGPKGILFLTDQRLIFEQREEVVTKKKFGLFKADSEMIQEVHVDVEVHQIENVSHKEEGGFMGMGKADILELVFAASANISRARFHLKGQNSSEWAAMIKRVQTGDVDKDRSGAHVEALAEAGITSASFPTACPNCYAPIPTQPRGVTSYTCEFCGAVVAPQSPG
ncbi:MAG: hypothetical protein HND44_09185 [Chloroflexi bacterium]|nr:hypothetical protein [Ardenticatenaceae bacterium]MBL1128654.1 hypothetical protein [Chloroflexota bacterium]NOG34732.1 hypothetical protein [Chloroflexota bacterium]GIK55057.1 MAG: hypothetical protein BroJett015_07200 [Chloroflexota bacterium]